MQHAVLLGRDSWMRFSNRTYRSLPIGRRTIGSLASSSCLNTPRQACGLRLSTPWVRVEASTYVTMAP